LAGYDFFKLGQETGIASDDGYFLMLKNIGLNPVKLRTGHSQNTLL
jgi:hypothetical protein